MVIRLTKACGTSPGTLCCLRCDGTETWQPSTAYFAFHDLIHYAVETSLNYSEAFYGTVARGKDLNGFGTRDGIRDQYTGQLAWAESLVGILQWPSVGGGPDLSAQEVVEQLEAAFVDSDWGVPKVSEAQIYQIRNEMVELHSRWSKLAPGESLELPFPD